MHAFLKYTVLKSQMDTIQFRVSCECFCIIAFDIQEQYVGCYRVGGTNNRAMGPTIVDAKMTIDQCLNTCTERTVRTYFGLHVGNNIVVVLYVEMTTLTGN